MMDKLRFGVIADPQYGDKGSRIGITGDCHNDYRGTLEKLDEAVEVLNGKNLDFVAVMGDFVDSDEEDLVPVLEKLNNLRVPLVKVLGNHDIRALGMGARGGDFADNEQAAAKLGMSDRYYARKFGKYRVVVLDTNEGFLENMPERRAIESEFMEKCGNEVDYWLSNEHVWNGFVMEKQQEWLREQLQEAEEAGEKVILLGHDPIYPRGGEGLRNGDEVLKIIAEYQTVVVAGLAGHHHYGMYGKFGQAPFITFKGMLMGGETAFSIVEIDGNGVRTRGFGRENSYRFVRGA